MKIHLDDDGLIHREDGPAVEYDNGDKSWMVHGERHRLDGPAVVFHHSPERNQYWINGQMYTEGEFKLTSFILLGNKVND
jgi:hypothetical protein